MLLYPEGLPHEMRLDEVVREGIVGLFDGKKVVLELSSDLNNDYSGGSDSDIESGIVNLLIETNEHRGSDVKIVAKKDGPIDVLEIFSSGGELRRDVLNLINRNYQEGKTLRRRPPYSGVRIAAYHLAQVGGEICIENCNQGPYSVRNYVRFGHPAP
jgi:hypothetical protein